MNRKRDFCTKAHANLFAEIIPTLSRLSINFNDGIPRLDSRNLRRRIFTNKAHNEFVRCRFLHTHHIKNHEKHKGKDNVDERARKSNRRASTHRLSHKIAFTRNFAFFKRIRILARHRHITAEGYCRNAIFRFAVAESEEFFPEADAEGIHLDVVPLGYQKVTKFVDCHKETQANEAENKHQDIAENRFHHS